MQTPFKYTWNRNGELCLVWNAYVALLSLETQMAAVRTAIVDKRFTREMLEAFKTLFSEREILDLLNQEVQDAD